MEQLVTRPWAGGDLAGSKAQRQESRRRGGPAGSFQGEGGLAEDSGQKRLAHLSSQKDRSSVGSRWRGNQARRGTGWEADVIMQVTADRAQSSVLAVEVLRVVGLRMCWR